VRPLAEPSTGASWWRLTSTSVGPCEEFLASLPLLADLNLGGALRTSTSVGPCGLATSTSVGPCGPQPRWGLTDLNLGGALRENTPAGYLASPANGDFHLTSQATEAIDRGAVVESAGLDLDGKPHTRGAPDLGADEYNRP
jgi:hypothetical protein